MIRLNPVTEVDDSVKRGLVPMRTDLEQLLGSDNFKEILRTDATTEEGQIKSSRIFSCWQLVGQSIGRMGRYKPKCYWFQAIL